MLRVNLLTADWLDDNHEEALTFQGNSKRMRQFFENLMYVCDEPTRHPTTHTYAPQPKLQRHRQHGRVLHGR